MANLAEAYDFSLFEDKQANTAPAIDPRYDVHPQEELNPKKNVVRIPREELEKSRRARIHPVKAILTLFSFAIIFGTVASIVYSQVRLAELTEEITVEMDHLENAQAIAVQLEMKSMQELSATDIESYAREELGMSKVTERQVVYLNMTNSDKGEVLKEDNNSLWDRLMNGIKSWFA